MNFIQSTDYDGSGTMDFREFLQLLIQTNHVHEFNMASLSKVYHTVNPEDTQCTVVDDHANQDNKQTLKDLQNITIDQGQGLPPVSTATSKAAGKISNEDFFAF